MREARGNDMEVTPSESSSSEEEELESLPS